MNRPKAINRKELVAFILPIEQDRSRGGPVKTEYDENQGAALVESDEEAVELRSVTPVMAANTQRLFFVEASGEQFRKNRKN